MKKIISVLVLSFVALPAHADITWAVAGPYTGAVASMGLSQQTSIKQAIDDINATVGVNGQKIALKFYDDACDPKQAVAVANKIISDNLRVILHGSCSGAFLAAEKVYLDEGVLVINPASSNIKITDEGGSALFRTMYRDDGAAVVLADYILKHQNGTKLAILHDKTTYGQSIAESVRDRLNKNGFKETLFESYDPSNPDYSVLVARLKQAGIEVLFVGGTPVPIATITRQLRQAGSKIQIIGGDLDDPDYWKVAGQTGEGALFSSAADPRKEVGAKQAVAELQKAGVTVDGYALYAYAAAQVLAQAMTKTASSDPVKLAAFIHANEFDTILGKWTFDSKGDVRNIRSVMYRWHDGQFGEIKE